VPTVHEEVAHAQALEDLLVIEAVVHHDEQLSLLLGRLLRALALHREQVFELALREVVVDPRVWHHLAERLQTLMRRRHGDAEIELLAHVIHDRLHDGRFARAAPADEQHDATGLDRGRVPAPDG